MPFDQATMTRAQLDEALAQARRRPHGDVHKGKLIISPEAFTTEGRETNLNISRFTLLDCTGSIFIGAWCMFGARSRIYTHDHVHLGRRPLLELQEQHGVVWQDKYIGRDVWIHDNAIVLYQVTVIPDGVVLGAGSVLTSNPEPYEIWAGVPARKIGERKEMSPEEIEARINRPGFSLSDYLKEI